MRRSLANALCVSAAIAFTSCSRPPPAPTPYADKSAGFTVQIPHGWSITRGYGDVDLLLTPASKSLSVRVAILHDAPDQASGKPRSLEDYVEFRRPRLGHFGKQRLLLRDEHRTLNAHLPRAHVVEYEYETGPQQLVRTRAWLLSRDGHGFTVLLTAPPAEFERWKQYWELIESSFRLE